MTDYQEKIKRGLSYNLDSEILKQLEIFQELSEDNMEAVNYPPTAKPISGLQMS